MDWSQTGQSSLLKFNPQSKSVQRKLQITKDTLYAHSQPLLTLPNVLSPQMTFSFSETLLQVMHLSVTTHHY